MFTISSQAPDGTNSSAQWRKEALPIMILLNTRITAQLDLKSSLYDMFVSSRTQHQLPKGSSNSPNRRTGSNIQSIVKVDGDVHVGASQISFREPMRFQPLELSVPSVLALVVYSPSGLSRQLNANTSP